MYLCMYRIFYIYRLTEFRYADLHRATNGFHESCLIGRGGFSTVYYGESNSYVFTRRKKNHPDVMTSQVSSDSTAVYIHRCIIGETRDKLELLPIVLFKSVQTNLNSPMTSSALLETGSKILMPILSLASS